ncbi:phosphoribosyltransferase family protein [Uniformispora flossi]|uniref:phosphoribosyltransferase family protein n=1 Tax=Uniformispora flossi TaxID=3390723 RepID=UPI003C2FE4A8
MSTGYGVAEAGRSGGSGGRGAFGASPASTDSGAEWSGTWVARRLGLRMAADENGIGPSFSTDVTAPHDGAADLRGLVGLALRRNPRRAHLLVSTVLGKHVPQLPELVHESGRALGVLVAARLADDVGGAEVNGAGRVDAALGSDGITPTDHGTPAAARTAVGSGLHHRPVVLGYAETATGLGHCVAEMVAGATYLHSTRRPVAGVEPLGGFEEEHSHATSHLLLPEDPTLLSGHGPLVLVDDELSTGRTVLNTIAEIHAVAPRSRYVIASLIDVRTGADRAAMAAFAAELGARVDVVALASGVVTLPEDALSRGQELVAAEEARGAAGRDAEGRLDAPGGGNDATRSSGAAVSGPVRASVFRLGLAWPAGLPDGGRHGFTPDHQARLDAALPALGAQAGVALAGARRVLVLGFEELMYVPLRLARALADALPEAEVRYSTTTRSPVLAVDDPGYAIRTRLDFPAHDDPADGPGPRYAYNVDPGADAARRFDTIAVVVDSTADTAALHADGGLVDRLAGVTDRVAVVVVPSYVPASAPPRTSAVATAPAGALPDVPESAVPDREVAI